MDPTENLVSAESEVDTSLVNGLLRARRKEDFPSNTRRVLPVTAAKV